MPRRKSTKSSKKKSYTRRSYKSGKPRRNWSNSTGTRFYEPYFSNPTIGHGNRYQVGQKPTWEAMASLEVVRNPFADTTQQPRFPDGKASESIGFRGQMIAEFEQANDGVVELLFFPGVDCCCVLRNVFSDANPSTLGTPNVLSYMELQQHLRADLTISDTAGTINIEQSRSTAIAKWRPVSYGMHISLVNNADENDGWWEAIRVSLSNETDSYSVPVAANGAAQPPDNTANEVAISVIHKMPDLKSSQMLANQSYSTGKLRDIHQVLFCLNPEMKEHAFNDVPLRTQVTSVLPETDSNQIPVAYKSTDMLPAETPVIGRTSTLPNVRAQDSVMDAFVDTSYDAIFVRIHGRPAVGGRSASRFTVHTVQNQELVYDENSENAKFHQGSLSAGRLISELYIDDVNGQPAAIDAAGTNARTNYRRAGYL